MKVKIKRLDTDLTIADSMKRVVPSVLILLCRESVTIAAQTVALIPANVIVETPPGYMLMVTLRSSTPRKLGLLIPHGVGVIDLDYCGEGDEIQIQIYNFTNQPVTIERGVKIAQGIFVRVDIAEWSEVSEMDAETRGGFGSTDSKN